MATPDILRSPSDTAGRSRHVIQRVLRGLVTPGFMFPAIAFLIFIVLWEVFARNTDPVLFPRPLSVIGAYGELISSGELQTAFLTTMQTLLMGFALSTVVGVVIGLIMGRSPIIADVFEPYIDAIYATPRVVIVPLVILWFGVGDFGRLFLVFIGTVIPIIMNTAVGVRNARPDLVEVGLSFGASERELARHVILPGSVPYVMAGMRVAVGRALVGVVIAEIFLDLTGLGGLIQTNSAYFRVDEMLAAVIILAIIGTVSIWGMGKIESYFSVWR